MQTPFEPSRVVTDLSACRFYHTLELPISGLQQGPWDLRAGVDRYLPPLAYDDLTVLDVGASSGFLTFELERRGAQVIAFDIADGADRDMLPFRDLDREALEIAAQGVTERTKNAFWLAHRELGSSARAVYGNANALPDGLGPIDVALFGNILQHLRDPLGVVERATRLAHTIVVTEALWYTTGRQDQPALLWLPALSSGLPSPANAWSWWQVNAELLSRWLEALGYRVTDRYDHRQLFRQTGEQVPHYTLVASRNHGAGSH